MAYVVGGAWPLPVGRSARFAQGVVRECNIIHRSHAPITSSFKPSSRGFSPGLYSLASEPDTAKA